MVLAMKGAADGAAFATFPVLALDQLVGSAMSLKLGDNFGLMTGSLW